MRPFLSLLLGLSLFICCLPAHGQEEGAGLQTVLEKAYFKWCDAMLRKDAQAWAASISRFRQTVIRNSVVSERLSFPDAVFASEVKPPELAGLRLLEAQAVGDTAHLVYFGRIDLGQDKELIRENVLKLKFLRENGVWKYDSNRISRLDSAPDVLKALQEGKRPDFLDTPEYTPPGTLPPMPPLCRIPDYKAGSKLQSFGYATTMSMNGVTYETVQDGLDQQVLIGGLVKGHNEITLNIKAVQRPEGEKPVLQIRVYLLPREAGKPGTEVLRWEAPESGASARITLPIVVKP